MPQIKIYCVTFGHLLITIEKKQQKQRINGTPVESEKIQVPGGSYFRGFLMVHIQFHPGEEGSAPVLESVAFNTGNPFMGWFDVLNASPEHHSHI